MSNKVLEKLPNHLKTFILKQPYDEYTPQNQAVWRYVMKKNIDYLSKVAHKSYLDGLEKTGISIEHIPRMEGMNRILKDIGWAAVSVDGFIPPNAFMEFQAYNILVVAADIRTAEHIEYTPAPDIIHEAAGHAPIIANPEYAEYLRRFGEIGSKAISSEKDYELYEAIRHLSIIKEDPNTLLKDIMEAEAIVKEISNSMGEISEMSKMRNMHWWTVEYGLIGNISNPKIYGAGLLSSIGESKWCMSDKVRKVAYSIEASNVEFNITKPQPHLFVSPNFAYLSFVLEEFANKMALRNGGIHGVEKLINSRDLGTIELSTGIQISGKFVQVISDEDQNPIYIKTNGPTALAYNNKELIGHDKSYHKDGFGSPIGKLKGINIAIEDMSPTDLETYGISEGKTIKLQFEGGIEAEGEIITGRRNLQGKIILISFKNCTVKMGEEILFDPSWGIYDMAIGASVISAYSGLADPNSYGLFFEAPKEKTHKIAYSRDEKKLHNLYYEVRSMVQNNEVNIEKLQTICNNLISNFTNDWLLLLEIYEIFQKLNHENLASMVLEHLNNLAKEKSISHLIQDGIKMINKKI